MHSLKTIEWFGIRSNNHETNAAPERTGAWIKLVYQLSCKDGAHPRYWRLSSQLLRVARPDLWGQVQRLNEQQAEQALMNLLEQHIKALDLPLITVAERELVTPNEAHWVTLYESRIFSHALTVFAVLVKTSEGLCAPHRESCLSVLYAPRRIERWVQRRAHHKSSWEVALWLNQGYSTLLNRALRSPANEIALEALL